jgi:hypothetical protein
MTSIVAFADSRMSLLSLGSASNFLSNGSSGAAAFPAFASDNGDGTKRNSPNLIARSGQAPPHGSLQLCIRGWKNHSKYGNSVLPDIFYGVFGCFDGRSPFVRNRCGVLRVGNNYQLKRCQYGYPDVLIRARKKRGDLSYQGGSVGRILRQTRKTSRRRHNECIPCIGSVDQKVRTG